MSQQVLSEKALAVKRDGSRGGGALRTFDPILSLDEVCAELRCSRWHFNKVLRKHISVVVLSHRLRGVRRSELDRFIDSRTVPAAEATAT